MQIHIGHAIREEVRKQGLTNERFANRLSVHPRTVQKIFLKSSIDTQQLLRICRVLKVDFFQQYSVILSTPELGAMPNSGIEATLQ